MENDSISKPNKERPSELTIRPTIEEVVQMARETFGSEEKARRWLDRPTQTLSGKSPRDVALAGASGVREVVDLLKRIDHGLSV